MKKNLFLLAMLLVGYGMQLKAQSPAGTQTLQTIPLIGNGQMEGNLTLTGKLLVNDRIVTNRITYPDSCLHIGDSSLVIENFLTSNGDPYNYDRISSSFSSLALGNGCVATTFFATSLGRSSIASASNATAIGSFANASGTQSLALGSGTGTNHTAAGASSITLGINVQTGSSATNAITIGRNMTNSTANSLMIGFSPSFGSTVPSIYVGPAASGSVGGKVGLGTSSPSTALHVIGDVTISSLAGTGSRTVLVDNTGKLVSGGINWALGGNSITVPTNAATEYLGTSSNSDLYINTNATPKMLIKTSGWVGVGTTTPTSAFGSMLEVKASGGSTFSITGNATGDLVSSGSLRPHFASTTDFSIYEGYPGTGTSTLRMLIKDGKIGFGDVASLTTDFEFKKNNADCQLRVSTNTSTKIPKISLNNTTNSSDMYLGSDAAGPSPLVLDWNGTHVLSFNDGNMLIGDPDDLTRSSASASDMYTKLTISAKTSGGVHPWNNIPLRIVNPDLGSTIKTVFEVLGNGATRIGIGRPHSSGAYADAMLSVDGKILAKEVRVTTLTTLWADYVFDPGYKLMSLGEVEKYYTTEKHLPNVPSASEVAENGVDVAGMSATLLRKIEENTLYLVELKKEIEALKKENLELKKQLIK